MFHRETGVFKTSYAADMALYPLPIARWTVAVLALFFVLVVPLVCNAYLVTIVNLVLIAVVGALGLNILVGYTGQISIGHGAFMSVGAYTAANLVTQIEAHVYDGALLLDSCDKRPVGDIAAVVEAFRVRPGEAAAEGEAGEARRGRHAEP